MSSKIVTATNLDSVRIEVLGESRAVTIPADLILAVDRVLREALVSEEPIEIDLVSDEDGSHEGWEASMGNTVTATQNSPWSAMKALANELEATRLP